MSVFSFVGLQYGDCPLMGRYSEQGTGESFEMIVSCDSEELRNSRLCETRWQTMDKSTVRKWTTCDK